MTMQKDTAIFDLMPQALSLQTNTPKVTPESVIMAAVK